MALDSQEGSEELYGGLFDILINPALQWSHIAWVKSICKLPIVLKGILTGWRDNCFYRRIFILSREGGQCAIRARLGVAGHLSTTPRWGNSVKSLSQRHNK